MWAQSATLALVFIASLASGSDFNDASSKFPRNMGGSYNGGYGGGNGGALMNLLVRGPEGTAQSGGKGEKTRAGANGLPNSQPTPSAGKKTADPKANVTVKSTLHTPESSSLRRRKGEPAGSVVSRDSHIESIDVEINDADAKLDDSKSRDSDYDEDGNPIKGTKVEEVRPSREISTQTDSDLGHQIAPVDISSHQLNNPTDSTRNRLGRGSIGSMASVMRVSVPLNMAVKESAISKAKLTEKKPEDTDSSDSERSGSEMDMTEAEKDKEEEEEAEKEKEKDKEEERGTRLEEGVDAAINQDSTGGSSDSSNDSECEFEELKVVETAAENAASSFLESEVPKGSLTASMLERISLHSSSFSTSPAATTDLDLISKTFDIQFLIRQQDRSRNDWHNFAFTLKKKFQAANQHYSLSCSLFPVLGLMRLHLAESFNLPESFELSAWHLLFYDYLEKSNAFFESFLENIHERMSDEPLSHLLALGVSQASVWCSNKKLIEKYGAVPLSVKPPNDNSLDPESVLVAINDIIRSKAADMHAAYSHASSDAEAIGQRLQEIKEAAMAMIYRLLSVSFGEPVKQFVWEFVDTDGTLHRRSYVNPVQFYQLHLAAGVKDLVSVSSYDNMEKDRRYLLKAPERIRESPYRDIINVPMDKLTHYAQKAISAQKPVVVVGFWTGLNVKLGLLDDSQLNYSTLFGSGPENSVKTDRQAIFSTFNYKPIHAQLLIGYSLDPRTGLISKWCSENSWGTSVGQQGCFCMKHSWFLNYIYEILVSKDMLEPEDLALLESDPIRKENPYES